EALARAGMDPVHNKGVTIVKQPFDMNLFLNRQIDAASAMTYNELAQVLETKNPKTGNLYKLSQLNVIKMSKIGTGMLEDGVFTTESWIKDKKNQDTAKKFLAASFKGWIYCRTHLKDCVKIVLSHGPTLLKGHQTWQMNEINALIWPSPNGIGLMNADDYVADVYVEDERISLIGESLDQPADKVIDASGKYVLPGGVDPHTHLDMPFGGTVTIDDVESGQTSAAFGGTTTHVDFIIQPQGSSFADALEEWRGKANGKQMIDMGYHMAVTDLKEGGTLDELASLPDQGITSYKLFMAYKGALMVDDETLFKTMQVAADTGAL